MFRNTVSTDRDTPSPEPLAKRGDSVYLFIHSFIHSCMSMEPLQMAGLCTMGVRPGSPRGSLTTLLSLPQCHAALGTIPSTLAWVDQSPVRQRVS